MYKQPPRQLVNLSSTQEVWHHISLYSSSFRSLSPMTETTWGRIPNGEIVALFGSTSLRVGAHRDMHQSSKLKTKSSSSGYSSLEEFPSSSCSSAALVLRMSCMLCSVSGWT